MLNELILLKNNDYKQFSEKIINTKYEILGVKMEYLKKIAKNNINDYKSYFLPFNDFCNYHRSNSVTKIISEYGYVY